MQASGSTSRTGILKATAPNPTSQNDEDDFFPEEDVNAIEAAEVRRLAEEEELAASSGADDADLYEDPHGSMYSGPLATSVPTSVTHMRRRSRSKGRMDRSDMESDAGEGILLAPSARSKRKSNRKLSISSRRLSRRGSQSSVGSDATGLRGKSRQGIPTTAVESASSETGSEDEEGGKKPKRKGMLSAWFGTPNRPSLERASSSASILSRDTRKSSSTPKRRKPHRRRSSSFIVGRNEQSEHEGLLAEDEEESETDENDPYGLYGSSSSSISRTSSSNSGSSASSDDARSRRRHRRGTSGSMFMPSFGGSDPVFGENGEDEGTPPATDAEESDEDEPFFLDEITASRQTIYIEDEDLQILFQGWGEKTYKTILWSLGCVLSFGILSLLGKWIPDWWLDGRGKEREFGRASRVVVKTSHGTTYVVSVKTMTFANPVAISSIFPATSEPPPTSRNEAMAEEDEEESEESGNVAAPNLDKVSNGGVNCGTPSKAPSGSSTPVQHSASNGGALPLLASANGMRTPVDQGSLKSGKEAKLKEYKYVDFRYYRFLLHPISGNFHMSR
jgi:cation-transporting ATPase 13A2